MSYIKNVPNLTILEEIAISNNYKLNKDLDPGSEFEIYNEEVVSGFSCIMTSDYGLFSIDIINIQDGNLITTLKRILEEYGLETENLITDIEDCMKNQDEILTDYTRYWVSYRPYSEANGVLVRYRAFVEDNDFLGEFEEVINIR
ncbi:hypothetical protein OB236_09465 [Paenibacillus sp. WQ 127069]|uniref:DUF4265 domain-containing protein n=1 Tax=Paenibacillus baimaensis TaxID=2982185 RepID=A0ABT2UCN3_9BACL|nr:hypothetical protein [Paenibacillus sp. WQ 127069]MCU6792355.1 hypothetical protein [Paenibacillus sp. WQ 127069]